MSDRTTALSVIAQPPPDLDPAAVAGVVRAQFGLRGELLPLVSERDQNFELRSADGGSCVVKVTNALEPAVTTEFHTTLLQHLQEVATVRVPRVLLALDGRPLGEIAGDVRLHKLRVVTWVQGEQLNSLELDATLASRFGVALASLDRGLQGFSHPGDSPVLLWDLQRAAELRELTACIADGSARKAVTSAIGDFEQYVLPAMPGLRRQVIHGDANPENVLLSDEGIGFIDFSDAVRAPLICDVAIAASYLRSVGDEPLRFISPFVSSYHETLPLDAAEIELLFDLIRARLAATVTLLHWRQGARSDADEYRQKSQESESNASHFLAALDVLGRDRFINKINQLC
jgi:Ser/Thr protein kinase RdoA (MazF antagonist)